MQGPTSKPPHEWDESDVKRLITIEAKESTELEYKDSRALQRSGRSKLDISKDVSAIANAAGGILIYGVQEDGNVPTKIDIGVDPNIISKEWLESVINSNINPRIDGVRINQIELTITNPSHVIYVLAIPQTIAGGPHQAADNKYYKRRNFQILPMEDYEIRDVMRRALGPDLFCEVRIPSVAGTERRFEMVITIGNRSEEPALYAHIDLYVDERLKVGRTFGYGPEQRISCGIDNIGQSMMRYRIPWITPEMPPIWRGLDQEIDPEPLPLFYQDKVVDYYAAIVINAPHMSAKTSVFKLTPIEPTAWQRVTSLPDVGFKTYED